MGRRRRIAAGAKPTTISLTPAQKVAIRKLQAKRMSAGQPEPLLNDVVLEGIELLLEKEGWSSAELAQVFPEVEAKSAEVRVFPRKRRS